MVAFTCVCPAALAESQRGVSGHVIVNADSKAVWKTLSTMGNFDDKLQSVNGNEAVVEQKFKSLPLLGVATVLLRANVKPMERIDFQMIKSDKLKDFSGSWSISPLDDRRTKLNLTMNVDPGLPVPRFLVNKFIAGKVRSRLKKVKVLAESSVRKQARAPDNAGQ